MKKVLLALWMCCSLLTAFAQEKTTFDLGFETRMGYHREEIDGEKLDGNSGAKGDYLNLKLNGTIGSKFSYSWRQRFNKKINDSHFFDATDWVYLTYQADPNWSISAGKQVVLIGGYEYDAAPIDIFMASEYWNNIPCYQFGASVTYASRQGSDKLTAQVCESPFRNEVHNDLLSYNLYWAGQHGIWSTLWSANLIGYAPGKYISYLSLGNLFQVGDLSLQLDFMNRATSHQTYLFRDCSIVGRLGWMCTPQVELYAKASYDVNRTDHASGHSVSEWMADQCVLPGTELTSLGGGVQVYPLKSAKNTVRLHACASYTTGTNGNPQGALTDKFLYLNVGLTWKCHLLSWGK